MEFKHDDPITLYKDIEYELNKRIHAAANCRDFTLAFGRAMDNHLKQMKIHRKLITSWLKARNLPNKDEIAAISERIVKNSEKIDVIDDALYILHKQQKNNQDLLAMVRSSWEDLLAVLAAEEREFQSKKVKSLELELFELKQLFQPDLNLEELERDQESRHKQLNF